jgi:hypothetical protein
VAKAAKAALVAAPIVYPEVHARGAKVMGATSAFADTSRGPIAENECGSEARRRTVVVYLTFPEMLPSASLSQGVVFASRFRHGFRVWSRVH